MTWTAAHRRAYDRSDPRRSYDPTPTGPGDDGPYLSIFDMTPEKLRADRAEMAAYHRAMRAERTAERRAAHAARAAKYSDDRRMTA